MSNLEDTIRAMAIVAAEYEFGRTEGHLEWGQRIASRMMGVALEQGGVVEASQFHDVCDYLLAWTGCNEYVLLTKSTMELLVPKFKYDALHQAARAVWDARGISRQAALNALPALFQALEGV